MSSPVLMFYTTSGCHLCEQAESVLMRTALPGPVEVEWVDIATGVELVERYGERIPLLKRTDNDSELGWPFDEAEVARWLADVFA